MPADLQPIQAVVLGIVQGLTEFLPISSSAHLILVPWMFGWQEPGLAFDVALHLGTLLAIVLYFWRDWAKLAASIVIPKWSEERRLLVRLLVATLPGAAAGYLGDKWVSDTFHTGGGQWIVGIAMAALGVLLYVAERVANHSKPLTGLRHADALLIGLAQAFAVVPGVSRSGATITAGLLLGLRRESAARFSFLMAAPIIAGAGVKELLDLRHIDAGVALLPVAMGTLSAMAVGILAIAFLLRWLQRGTFLPFAVYRVVLGALILALYFAGVK